MTPVELREKSSAELNDELINLRQEQFNLRMAQATGQLVRSDQYRKVRRNIARVKTLLREQEQAQRKGETES